MDKPTPADLVDANETDQLLAEAARLRALAAFPAAIREYTVGLARFREAPRLINKLIS